MYVVKSIKRTNVFMFLILSLVIALGTARSQDTNFPQFENYAYMFVPDCRQAVMLSRLSPQGNFVAAQLVPAKFTESEPSCSEVKHLLWELPTESPLAEIIQVIPTEMPVSQRWHGSAFIFSPKGDMLAMKFETEMEVWDTLEIELIKTIPFIRSQTAGDSGTTRTKPPIGWSSDGEFMAVVVDSEIIAWNVASDQVFSHPFELRIGDNPDLLITNFGWIILPDQSSESPQSSENFNSFYVCTWDLEDCRSYDVVHPTTAVVLNGEDILIISAVGNGFQTSVWNRGEDGSYTFANNNLDISTPRNAAFNRDGVFLSMRKAQGSGFEIRSFPDLQPLMEVDAFDVAWLPDGKHFLSLDPQPSSEGEMIVVLKLHEVGEVEPLDMFEISEIANTPLDTSYFLEWLDIESVSEDGMRVLVNLGYGFLVFPITYN